MAYTGLDLTKPDGATQNGAQVLQSVRDNQRALRDMIVAGFAPGWGMTPSGGTAEQPAQVLYNNGPERLRAALTWGSTGGEAKDSGSSGCNAGLGSAGLLAMGMMLLGLNKAGARKKK